MKLENMVPYKTIICKRWKNEGHCYHPDCLYAHGENELGCDDGYYKIYLINAKCVIKNTM
jgi:hypothetical protein